MTNTPRKSAPRGPARRASKAASRSTGAAKGASRNGTAGGESDSATRSRPSMADVAQLAGCSQSSVSIVLNNTPGVRIGKATRNRVLEAVEALNYQIPRRRASGTAGVPPVAFIVDRLATSIEAVWSIEGAREALWPSGQILLVAQTLDSTDMEERTLQTFIDQGVQGIIYATNHTRRVEPPKMLYEANCPVVLLNCYSDDCAFPSVVPSEIAAGMRGTEYLLQIGHRRIAMITGEKWMEGSASRLTGYRRSLATADIAFDPQLVRSGNWQVNSGYERTQELMDLPNPPTAIFCSSDRMAVGCLEALKERSLRIPDDVSVIGFDNEDISQHVKPKLTTIQLPQAEMGQWAVDQIRENRSPRVGIQPQVKLECQLIERDSVAAPPAKASRARAPSDPVEAK